MKKTLTAIALTIGLSTTANAGWFDSKEQKLHDSMIKCYETIQETKDVSCTKKLMSEIEKMNAVGKELDLTKIDGALTQDEYQKIGMTIAFANNCIDPEMQENVFAMGMCKKAGMPYNKKFDDPEYAKNALFGSNK